MSRCAVCDDLDYPRDISKRSAAAYRRFYAGPNDLWNSAANGCASCCLVRDAILAFVPEMQPAETILVMICLQEYAYNHANGAVWYTPSPMPFITVTDLPSSRYLAQVDLFHEEAAPAAWQSIPVARRSSGDTSSDGSIACIESWLGVCRKDHQCDPGRGLATPPYLPARVVDVGASSSDQIRLHISAEDERGAYLCLSHCWGLVQVVRTLQSNIDAFVSEIPWGLLSKTFQDAVQVTRRLGFRYIWIDSLCIVQDSKDDWRVESAKMAQYYGSADLTIAATKSSDGQGGLFSTNQEALLEHAGPDGKAYRTYARSHVRHFGYPETAWKKFPQLKTSNHLASFPLLTRGWVYQERLLSPRMIHFGTDELVWECLESRDCECCAPPADDGGIRSPSESSMDLPKLALHKQRGEADSTVLANLWRFMTVRFTQLSLTFGTDKLPALQGCATMHGHALAASAGNSRTGGRELAQGDYLAGVWRDSILDDLLWHSENLLPRPQDWRAPSFSWASVDSSVVYPSRLSTLADEECTSSVSHGRLRNSPSQRPPTNSLTRRDALPLSGVLVGGSLRYSASSLLPEDDVDPEAISNERVAAGDPYLVSADNHDFVFSADYALSILGPHHVPSGSPIYVLRISQRLGDESKTTSDGIDFSLVLRLVDEDEQKYERIGLLDIMTRHILELAERHLFGGQTEHSNVDVV